jgi:hypothetical protein
VEKKDREVVFQVTKNRTGTHQTSWARAFYVELKK